MSLSDYIRYLRALSGGLTPWEIAEGSTVPARDIHLLEVKHKRIGEDQIVLEKLATYFKVPVEQLTGRREAYRKRLTFFVEDAQRSSEPVAVKLESGEELQGTVAWFSREAVALVPEGTEDAPCIVQRGWIADWRHTTSPDWEVATTPPGTAPVGEEEEDEGEED